MDHQEQKEIQACLRRKLFSTVEERRRKGFLQTRREERKGFSAHMCVLRSRGVRRRSVQPTHVRTECRMERGREKEESKRKGRDSFPRSLLEIGETERDGEKGKREGEEQEEEDEKE